MTLFEWMLDTPAWRGLERGRRLVRTMRSARRPPASAHDIVARALQDPRPDVAGLGRALDRARDAGAFEIAVGLAEAVTPRLSELRPRPRAAVVAAMVELRIAVGDARGAQTLAADHRALLATTARGATVLDVLRLRPHLEPFLPDGRVNCLALDRALDGGVLDGGALLALLARRPTVWLDNPEVHLLAATGFAADDAGRTRAFLSRYLRAQGLPRCVALGEGDNILERIQLERPRARHGGPLVSIIVSAFNASATIGYAIDSLRDQTYRNIEILVADDASDDGTLELLSRRHAGDPRVRLFRSPANQGQYNLRNALIAHARGSYITFHDADDLALPTRIERQARALAVPEPVACVTSWLRVVASGRAVFFRDQSAARLSLVSLMMRREALAALGPYRSVRFGADLELYEDLRARYGAARIVRLREPLIFGLWSDRSVTRSAHGESLEDGYRAPARRLYSELVFRKHFAGLLRAGEAEIAERVAASGNRAEALPIVETS